MLSMVRDADVLIPAYRDLVTEEVLAASKRLRLVTAPFIGVDGIDVEAATRLGILVCNSPREENFIGVAEATIGAMLILPQTRASHRNKVTRGRLEGAS